jgi:hypothetical protein
MDEFGNQFRYKAKVNSSGVCDQSDIGRWAYDVFLVGTERPESQSSADLQSSGSSIARLRCQTRMVMARIRNKL